MKRTCLALTLMALIGFAHYSLSQQPLLVPELTVVDLFGMEPRNAREGLQSRVIRRPTMRLNRIDIAKGYSTPNHNHPDEEMVLVIQGRVRAFSGNKQIEVGPGEVIVIPAYVPHHYEALEDTMTIEAFGPGREVPAGG